MPCLVNGSSIEGDQKGKIQEIIIKMLSQNHVAKPEAAKVALVSVINKDFASFKETIDEYFANAGLHLSINNVQELLSELGRKNNGFGVNDVKHILLNHYKKMFRNVEDSSANDVKDPLHGFTSDRARRQALDYIAVLFKIEHFNEGRLPKDKRSKTGLELIQKIRNRLLDNFYSENGVVWTIIKKAQDDKYLEDNGLLEKKNEIIKAATLLNEVRANLETTLKLGNNEKDAAKRKELGVQYIQIRGYYTSLLNDFVQKYLKNNNKIINQLALVNYSSTALFNKIFENKRLHSLGNQYKKELEENPVNEDLFYDEDDFTLYDESVDETSKTWNNNLKLNSNEFIPQEIRIYLDTIFMMNSPFDPNNPTSYNKNDNKKENPLYELYYDYDNEVGVPVAMNWEKVRDILTAMGDFSSVRAFIDSIDANCKNMPEFYGFSKIVNDMRNNRMLAYQLYIALSHPIMKKTMMTLENDGEIRYMLSNPSSSAIGTIIFKMLNELKKTYRNEYDRDAHERLMELRREIVKVDNSRFANNTELRNKLDDTICYILKNYFPSLSKRSILNYLYSDKENAKNLYIGLISNIDSIGTIIYNTIESVKDEEKKNRKKWADYYKAKNNGDPNVQMPNVTYDAGLDTDNDNLQKSIISIAKKIEYFTIAQLKLNSKNGEGNSSSDQVDNCWLTRVQEIINNRKALESFGNEIAAQTQNSHSVIFFGIPDPLNPNGDPLVRGMFKRDANGRVTVDDEGIKYFSFRLFNGGNNEDYSKTMMYNTMSKADMFRTQLEIYSNALKDYDNPDVSQKNCFEAFTQTPADSPRRHIMKMPKYQKDSENLFNSEEDSINEYIQLLQEQINKRAGELNNNGAVYNAKSNDHYETVKKSKYVVSISKEELFNLLVKQDNISYRFTNDLLNDKEAEEVNVPLVYKTENTTTLLYVQGNRASNTNLISDVELRAVYSFNNDGTVNKNFYKEFFKDNLASVVELGDANGYIKYNIGYTTINNRAGKTIRRYNSPLFYAFKQQVIGELTTFVDQLNTLFPNGVLKKDKVNLHDRLHYNGKSLVTVENGVIKLTGNIFKLNRLFKIGDFSLSDKLLNANINGQFLYGESGLIIQTEDGFEIDMSQVSSSDNAIESIIADDGTGKLQLNITDELNNVVDELVSQWLQLFRREIVNNAQQYTTVTGKYTTKDIVNAMLHGVIAEYNMAELFGGDVKIYKDAQDYFKRYKEIQAGGDNFCLFDIEDGIGGELHDIEDGINKEPLTFGNKKRTITVGSRELHNQRVLSRRNGWRAATIKNSNSVVDAVGNVKVELNDILFEKFKLEYGDVKLAKDKADKISTQIARGYSVEKTKKNDAQSYITFEEFCMRRVADGTIGNYADIIDQILDLREENRKAKEDPTYKPKMTIEDIDVSEINARIQVQKNFYYDQKYYKDTNIVASRQVKNAEFVLIPELLEGTELYTVWEIMNKYDIGQLNTEETVKAGKRNVLNLWDDANQFHPDIFEKQLNDNPAAIENYYYEFLYKQQDVASHLVDKENKAGIQILKKLIDNYTDDVTINGKVHKGTRHNVKAFIDAYCANIKHSFDKMLYNCGWMINEDDTLVNFDGSPISFDSFYQKAKREAIRQGLDSNLVDYFVRTPNGKQMPNWMNNVSSKLESIAQSMFNSAITRQTLPGFHVAQVTGIGHGAKVLDSNNQWRELKYHPAEINPETGETIHEAYAEVMVPRWSNLLPKDITPEELSAKGIDIMIGYRIPTEGKQSVSILKVVGILNDVYDSTMMVPDAWVTQTGSDFDVDSIYTIIYGLDRYGNKEECIFDEGKTEDEIRENQRIRYQKYIKEFIDTRYNEGFFDEEDDEVKELKKQFDELDKFKDEVNRNAEETVNFVQSGIERIKNEALKTRLKKEIKKINRENSYKDKKSNQRKYNYKNILSKYQIELAKLGKEFYSTENENAQLDTNIINLLFDTVEQANKLMDQLSEEKQESYFNFVVEKAKKEHLISFDDFIQLDILEQQTTNARNNYILDNMIAIMENTDSREENYSRSNHDDLDDAKNKIDKMRKNYKGISDKEMSAYNPFDQLNYFEDAMSGARLKAFSVTRDTFDSICNYSKAELSDDHVITVRYDLTKNKYTLEEVKEKYKSYKLKIDGNNVEVYDNGKLIEKIDLDEKLYKKEDIVAMVGEDDCKVSSDGKSIIVYHRKFGHSNNNRNVLGKLLTCYSSQTTAHILDAIKIGIIYNENDFTFGSFKTLIDVGIDYETAISLLALPGIDRIVQEYYDLNSIYTDNVGKPIDLAIKSICSDLNIKVDGAPITKYTKISDIFEALNKDYRILSELNKYSVDRIDGKHNKIEFAKFVIDGNLYQERLSSEYELADDEEGANIFDLMTILTFRQLYATTQNIENLTRIANPDKFGAKQTIRETFETLENVDRYRSTGDDEGKDIGKTLIINGLYFTDAIYPIINGKINVKESSYPYLAAFLKYATKPSSDINQDLFELDDILLRKQLEDENEEQYAFISQLEKHYFGRKLSPKEYKALKQYYVASVYNKSLFLTEPITLDENNRIIIDEERKQEYESRNKEWNIETERIFGRKFEISKPFKCVDPTNPTEDEVKEFNKLTPVEKLLYVQKEFSEIGNLSSKLSVNVFSSTADRQKGINKETIQYFDQVESIEETFSDFINMFRNKNKLLRLTAIDFIKYAFIVEGFKFKGGNISKIIPNYTLYTERENYGTGLLEEFDLHEINKETLYRQFIRSHQNIAQEINLLSFTENEVNEEDDTKKKKYNKKEKKTAKGNLKAYDLYGGAAMFIPTGSKLHSRIVQEFDESKEPSVKSIPQYVRIKSNRVVESYPSNISAEERSAMVPEQLNAIRTTDIIQFSHLYEVRKLDDGSLLLFALPLLEENEYADVSSNQENNEIDFIKEDKILKRLALLNPLHFNQIEEEVKEKLVKANPEDYKTIKGTFTSTYRIEKKMKSVKINYDGINKIINDLNSTNPYFSGPARKIHKYIKDYFNDPVEGHPTDGLFVLPDDSYIKGLLRKQKEYNVFNIQIGDNAQPFIISRYKIKGKKQKEMFRDALNYAKSRNYNYSQLEAEYRNLYSIEPELRNIIKQLINGGVYDGNIYQFEKTVIDVEEQMQSSTTSIEEMMEKEGLSATDPINMVRGEEEIADKSIQFLSLNIDKINKQYKKGNELADPLITYLKEKRDTLDIKTIKDLRLHQKELFELIAKYYVETGERIFDEFTNFECEDGTVFNSINSNEFFAHLSEHPEDLFHYTKLLFDAKRFGYGLMELIPNIKSDNPAIQDNINRIQNIINKVHSSEIFINSFKNLFNKYIADNFSSNPMVREGLIELRTAFGDNNTFDRWFSDIGELSNKQVQTVAKYVYSVLNSTTRIVVPQLQKKFNEEFDELYPNCDFSKFINEETGQFIEDYNDNYIEDIKKYREEAKTTRLAKEEAFKKYKDGEITKEELISEYIDYYTKKLNRDKWYAKNTEQELKVEYYNEKNDNLEKILNEAPRLFAEYQYYQDLRRQYPQNAALTEDEKNEIIEINKKISDLTTGFGDVDLVFNEDKNKFEYTLTPEQIKDAEHLNEYKNKEHEINKKYFNSDEFYEWNKKKEECLKVLKDYNEKHPDEDIVEKLNNSEYKEAYDWLKLNAYQKLNERGQQYKEELKARAYRLKNKNILSDYIEMQGIINQLYAKDNAYKLDGSKDPTKLSKESLQYIKKLYEDHYRLSVEEFGNTENNYSRYASVIKDVPEMPIFKEEYYSEYETNKDDENFKSYHEKRNKLIPRINELLIRIIDDNGHISTTKMFDVLSRDEIKELGNLFDELREIKLPKVDKKGTSGSSMRTVTVNTNFINEQCEAAKLSNEDFALWMKIFCGNNKKGRLSADIPNREIYGYIVPRKTYNKKKGILLLEIESVYDKYVDKEATSARKKLDDLTRDVIIDEYYIAKHNAEARGELDQWMLDNHYYDRTTHKLVPLPIWTKEELIPGGVVTEEMASYQYLPINEFKLRYAKPEAKNKNYNKFKENFAVESAENKYKNNSLSRDSREYKMKELLQKQTRKYAISEDAKRFYTEGFLPREYAAPKNLSWYGNQLAGIVGLDLDYSTKDTWASDEELYDEMPKQNMYAQLRAKGQKAMPNRNDPEYAGEEGEKKYYEDLEKAKKYNLELEKEIRSRNYRKIFNDLILHGEEYNARMRIKNIALLLLEDLKENEAYKTNFFTGKLQRKENNTIINNRSYEKEKLTNTYSIVHNWVHRVINQEFKQKHVLNKAARIMQSLASAKYMMLNLTGGISNVQTGLANIYGEMFAKEYFGAKEFYKASLEYASKVPTFITHFFNNEKPTNEVEALIRFFDIVEYDEILGIKPGDTAEIISQKINSGLYSMQSGGEHYMQNTALLAMLNTYRVYTNAFGKLEIGSLVHYRWNAERLAMNATLVELRETSDIENKADLLAKYQRFIKDEVGDIDKLADYDQFKRDFNREFLKASFGDKYAQIAEIYINKRNALLEEYEKKFLENKTLREQFKFDDKQGLMLANDSKFIKSIDKETGKYETVDDYEKLIGMFVQTAISVNNKIHGVYNKIGAAKIESEWYGSLIMQYHKHIYPGIMKRYRGLFGKSYFNEIRGTVERGSYVSLADFLGTEFDGIFEKAKQNSIDKNSAIAIESIREVMKAVVRTATNMKLNWNMMNEFERSNCKRALGDLVGMLKAAVVAMLIYGLTDDDDIKSEWWLATGLYVADKDYSEAAMYTPWGLMTEGKTLWSSPIAANNHIDDALKLTNVVYNMLTDEDFDYNYTTGQYKGHNKAGVLISRNIPIYRVYNRLMNMPKNNKYYRLGNVGISKTAKKAADVINPD